MMTIAVMGRDEMAEPIQCPFCGRIPTVEDCGTNRWFVRCKCGIAQDKLYHQRCDAVRAWNRRKSEIELVRCRDKMGDTISRQAAISAIKEWGLLDGLSEGQAIEILADEEKVPSAQTEQRYTEEELRVFQHGISLSLLSKRSAQHWRYDEDTATEIEFLERLYEKVGADMRGGQDETN